MKKLKDIADKMETAGLFSVDPLVGPGADELGKLFLIVGPSGTGKTTLVRALQKQGLTEVVSYTTRAPRAGEVDGRDYFFVSRDEFAKIEQNGQFVEVVEYNGNRYGTHRGVISAAMLNGDAMIIVEPHGAVQLREAYPHVSIAVFLEPPPTAELRLRLEARGDKPEVIEKRLSTVLRESQFKFDADYVIPPTTPEKTLALFQSILLDISLCAGAEFEVTVEDGLVANDDVETDEAEVLP